MTETYKSWLWEKMAQKCVKNLTEHGFDAHFVQTVEQARELALKIVNGCKTFGFGGSSTVREIGILEELKGRGDTIHDHWQDGLTNEQILDIRLLQGRCDCFFCSANAVSLTGEIINVDGAGNRTAAMSFGPKKVIIIAGMNKVTPDIESSLRRVREIAGPMRAKSLGLETPCAETGICIDCNSPQRICRITAILHRRPSLTDVSVILINRELGF
ncbi:MAG: lactate utilization protein [Deltaproteobacteria bacterium]|nr:lactate utilization protein [Deltaproteobacteria bacterium]